MNTFLYPFLLILCAVPAGVSADVDFSRDIRPILSDKCFHCHGPDEKDRKAGLRLDSKEGAFSDNDGVTAFKAGDLDASESWYRIMSDDPDELMPPPKAKKPLSEQEKSLIKQWIESGAEWDEHWSFIVPQKVEVTEARAIDHLVRAELEKRGLSASAEAGRETLIRRLSFDLTGLPPTLAEVRSFVADQSPDAYEKLVDRLLASPQYGERMALYWLDAARYGDTSVMHADGFRDMWPWRDWVVKAFNTNQPFDQFSIDQIAGDLIPNASAAQKIASGFNRNHPSSDEGGAIAEELRVSYVVDRVKTTANVWLGLSMECAQCHDHKYDPVSQREYYQFYAYFNNTRDPGMQSRKGNHKPTIEVPDRSRDEKIKLLTAKKEKIDQQLVAYREGAGEAFSRWLVNAREEQKGKTVRPQPAGLVHHFPIGPEDKNQITDMVSGAVGVLKKGGQFETVNRDGGKALKLNGRTDYAFSGFPDYEGDSPLTFSAWLNVPANTGGAVFSKMDRDHGFQGYDFWLQGSRFGTHIISQWGGDALKVVSETPLAANKWQHVAVVYDGSRKAAGVKIYIDGKPVKTKVEADRLKGSIIPPKSVPFKIGGRNKSSTLKGIVDDIRIYTSALSEAEIEVAREDPAMGLLTRAEADLNEKDRETLKVHYLNRVDEDYRKLVATQGGEAKALKDLSANPTTTMIMGDNPPDKMRMTYILDRGQYDSPKKDTGIPAGTPAILPPLPVDAPPNRLTLANWFFADEHPLTSRVSVNQLWQLFFGTGIVETPADFGAQGSFPSHPGLLDWLAVDFRESGWDVKRMIRQIVMSGTYRQSSNVRPEDYAQDPGNLLLARAPRYRLTAEMIRDNALSLSGLLVGEMGGPGVKPYQPPGLWAEVSLGGEPKFVQDHGGNLYRRSLYTYWKRSAPHPAMVIFDAPNRETCVLKRPSTNTPLQALAALNDVQMLEASRRMAERILKEGGGTPEARAAFAFELATARKATSGEIATMVEIYDAGLARYADTGMSKALLSAGESRRDESLNLTEHAAWTVVASLVLNLDEVLTRN